MKILLYCNVRIAKNYEVCKKFLLTFFFVIKTYKRHQAGCSLFWLKPEPNFWWGFGSKQGSTTKIPVAVFITQDQKVQDFTCRGQHSWEQLALFSPSLQKREIKCRINGKNWKNTWHGRSQESIIWLTDQWAGVATIAENERSLGEVGTHRLARTLQHYNNITRDLI